MRIWLVISYILVSYSQAFTGVLEVKVQKTETGNFSGLLWSDVDKTVGDGKSPNITADQLRAAIDAEFEDPAAAWKKLEELKGPAGKLVMEYNYVDNSKSYVRELAEENEVDLDNQNGDLTFRCGVVSQSERQAKFNNSASEADQQYASSGKFFQFKWASQSQIRRHMANCLSRLPGMPKLKTHEPQDPPQFYISDGVYDDFYNWFSTIPGFLTGGKKHPKFRAAVHCLIQQASRHNADRTGNVIVLQSAKQTEDSPYNYGTFKSEVDNLPRHLGIEEARGRNRTHYSIAFMDKESAQKLNKNWKEDAIQTQGIWPNYQGGSVASLMGQAFGDELNTNMKACLLSAGIKIPNVESIFPTIYNPSSCKDVDIPSLSTQEQLELLCENSNKESCYFLGLLKISGKSVYCLPKDLGGACMMSDVKREHRAGKENLLKSCGLGSAPACYTLGELIDNKTLITSSMDETAIQYLEQGCKIHHIPACYFFERGIASAVTESNLQSTEQACYKKVSFVNRKQACMSAGVYYMQKGKVAEGIKFLELSCEERTFARGIKPCAELATALVQQGKKAEAVEMLKKKCSFTAKEQCAPLYDLLDDVEKEKLINDVCWSTKKRCF